MNQLTFSQEASHASHSRLPGSEKAREMTVRCGRKCLRLFSTSSPVGLLAKMLLESSTWNSTLCYLRWKIRVMKSKRLLFQLAPSMPRTDGTGFGLWRTPHASDGEGGVMEMRPGTTGHYKLRDHVHPKNAKMWPTPTGRDHKDGTAQSCANVEENGLLGRVIHDKDNPQLGSLNPTWVEWLMGYPEGWTDLKDSETQ